jgi:hypothetical protein
MVTLAPMAIVHCSWHSTLWDHADLRSGMVPRLYLLPGCTQRQRFPTSKCVAFLWRRVVHRSCGQRRALGSALPVAVQERVTWLKRLCAYLYVWVFVYALSANDFSGDLGKVAFSWIYVGKQERAAFIFTSRKWHTVPSWDGSLEWSTSELFFKVSVVKSSGMILLGEFFCSCEQFY